MIAVREVQFRNDFWAKSAMTPWRSTAPISRVQPELPSEKLATESTRAAWAFIAAVGTGMAGACFMVAFIVVGSIFDRQQARAPEFLLSGVATGCAAFFSFVTTFVLSLAVRGVGELLAVDCRRGWVASMIGGTTALLWIGTAFGLARINWLTVIPVAAAVSFGQYGASRAVRQWTQVPESATTFSRFGLRQIFALTTGCAIVFALLMLAGTPPQLVAIYFGGVAQQVVTIAAARAIVRARGNETPQVVQHSA